MVSEILREMRAQIVIRRKRNKIHGMHIGDGSWSTYPEVLQMEALYFFSNLFDVPVGRNYFLDNATPTISEADRALLNNPVSLEEVRHAVLSMNSFKAPGADEFHAYFYKQYWHILGNDLHQLGAEAFQNGRADPALFEMLIVLIPKVEEPLRFKDLNPISLYNVAYKIITKVLVNMFRPVLSELVGPLQGSFKTRHVM